MRRTMLTTLAAMALMFSFTTSANADTFTQTINQHNVTVSASIPMAVAGPHFSPIPRRVISSSTSR